MTEDSMSIHGTTAGWNKHCATGVPICDSCRAAKRVYQMWYRSQVGTGCSKGLGWPIRREARIDALSLAKVG